MRIKSIVTGILAVLFCVMLILFFNKPLIPIAIGMCIGGFVFLVGYIVGL